MSKILFVMEFGGFPLQLEPFQKEGHEVSLAKSVRKALPLLKMMRPDLLVAEFNYTSQFRDRDSNLDTILTQIQYQSPDTRVIALVETEQSSHFDRFKSRFPQIRGHLLFPFEANELHSMVSSVLLATE